MGVRHRDIARILGIDRTTVSRALADHGRVSPATRERVRQLAEQMGYRPHKLASSLKTGKSDLIGIITELGDATSFERVYGCLQQSTLGTSYTTVVSIHTGLANLEVECIDSFIERRVDGVIAIPSSHQADPAPYRELLNSGAKLVLVDRMVEGLEAPIVVADDYKAARISAEYLIGLGHKRIAYLSLPLDSYIGRKRTEGYQKAHKDAGLDWDPSLIIPVELSMDAGEQAMKRLLSLAEPPTAVMVRYDTVGFGALKAVFDAGLSVPEDMSIVSYQDLWYNSIARVPLTTVHHPTDQIATTGVRLLMDGLEGRPVKPEPVIIDVELVVRNSCCPPRG